MRPSNRQTTTTTTKKREREREREREKKREKEAQSLDKHMIVSPRCLRKFRFQPGVGGQLTFQTIRNIMAVRGMRSRERRLRSTTSGRNRCVSFPAWTTARGGGVTRWPPNVEF